MNKVDRIRYKEYIKCANECPVNRVYPLSIATGTQDGDIYVDGKGCVLFWHYCGFAYISGAGAETARQPQCPEEKEKAIKDALEHFGMV